MTARLLDRRHFLSGATAALCAPGIIGRAHAQAPKTIRIIYPFAAGGGGDFLARIIADQISSVLSIPVIVENRTGAAGRIGAKAVIAAEPDGTTLLLTSNPVISIYPYSYASLDYDPFRDLAPISLIATFDVALAVSTQTNFKTIDQLVSWAKNNPDKANYGSPGAGGLGHFFAVMFTTNVGVPFRHVTYRGSGAVATDLLSGQIPMAVVPLGDLVELHKGGHAHILALSGGQRSPLLPDVPTFRELGFQIEGVGWYALYAPAKTPPDVIARINKVVVEALGSHDVKERILKMYVVPKTSTPAELAEFQKADSQRWAPAVKASGFTPQQ
jgi:tripartite-type tricarboxylate transporter receptor subunit TctC